MRSVFALVSVVAASPNDLVSLGLKNLDPDCVKDNCKEPMSACKNGIGKGGKDCSQRLSCSMNRDDFENCFTGLKWSDLENDEVKIFDCAKHSECMDVKTPGMSLLELQVHERGLVSAKQHAEDMARVNELEEMVEGLKKKAIASAQAEAAQKAMVEKAAEMIAENRAMLKKVSEDKDIDPKSKLEMMNTLQKDLANIKTKIASGMEGFMEMIDHGFNIKQPTSFVQVRPSSLSDQGAGMTSQATVQMNDILHKWERGIKSPSLMQAKNTDESTEMIQKATLQKDFEDNFRESYREAMMKANLRQEKH